MARPRNLTLKPLVRRLSGVLTGAKFLDCFGFCQFSRFIRKVIKSGLSIHIYLQVKMKIVLVIKLAYQHLVGIVMFEAIKKVRAAFLAEPSLCPV